VGLPACVVPPIICCGHIGGLLAPYESCRRDADGDEASQGEWAEHGEANDDSVRVLVHFGSPFERSIPGRPCEVQRSAVSRCAVIYLCTEELRIMGQEQEQEQVAMGNEKDPGPSLPTMSASTEVI
jgi:hypothetical protein